MNTRHKNHIEFTAFGAYCNDFINELVNSDYNAWDISGNADIYTVKTAPQNYMAIARLAGSYRVKTKVSGRSGVYFKLRRYKKRIGIPLGILAFFAIIVTMSNFIWSIRITGNHELSSYRIVEQLELHGIKSGAPIRGFNANQIELMLTLTFDELAWVNIERSGSRVNVKINERLPSAIETIPVSSPCNVVAKFSGQLIETEIYRGRLLYEVGSGVNAGDIVVSGVIANNTADPNNPWSGSIAYVHADAKLIAECIEIVEFYQPLSTFHNVKNGFTDNNTSMIFLGMRFGRDKIIANKNADNVVYSEEMRAPDIFGFPLPFRVLTQRYIYHDRIEVADAAPYALQKLNRQIELFELNFLGEAEIIEKQVEYFPDEEGIKAVAEYIFRVDVAEKVEILMGSN